MLSISKQGGRFFEKKAICSLVAIVDGPVIEERKKERREERRDGKK